VGEGLLDVLEAKKLSTTSGKLASCSQWAMQKDFMSP